MTPTAIKRTMKDIFETSPCTRCGGEGRLMQHSNVLGGTCFKCHGAKAGFTKRGKADYDRYQTAHDAATLRPISDLKIGDAIRSNDMKKYIPVIAISDPRHAGSGRTGDGPTIEHYAVDVTLAFPFRFDYGCGLGMMTSDTVSVFVGDTVRVWPGEGSMPRPEDFVTTGTNKETA